MSNLRSGYETAKLNVAKLPANGNFKTAAHRAVLQNVLWSLRLLHIAHMRRTCARVYVSRKVCTKQTRPYLRYAHEQHTLNSDAFTHASV